MDRSLPTLPLLTAFAAWLVVLAVPPVRAFGFREEAWVQAGAFLYVFLVPLAAFSVTLAAGAALGAVLAKASAWRRAWAYGGTGLSLTLASATLALLMVS